jgi:hypothetical protein
MFARSYEAFFKKETLEYLPVPRLKIKDIKEDALSKKLRQFDNSTIVTPLLGQLGIYINTNEHAVVGTSNTLSVIPLISKGCHIGFSGWHNFDIMAQRRSTRGIICDLNPENALFLYHVLLYVRSCNNRFHFVEKIIEFYAENSYSGDRSTTNKSFKQQANPLGVNFCVNVSEEAAYLYAGCRTVIDEMKGELQRPTGWLYNNERYEYIRALALDDKIALITDNICAFERFIQIARLLKDNMVQIDTVYVSNISHWIWKPEERRSFYRTIQSFLSDNQTILIDAHFNEQSETLEQRVTTAGVLNQTNLEDWFYTESLCDVAEELNGFSM